MEISGRGGGIIAVRELDVAVQFATSRRHVPAVHSLASWAEAAYGHARQIGKLRHKAFDLTIRVVGAAESRRLNRDWRGKDKPTNVLSFPGLLETASETKRLVASGERLPLGDLAICAPVVSREAREQGKTSRAHWAHMVVHGVLHLLGYDHENERDAQAMEGIEVKVLEQLGFGNPYAYQTRSI